MESYHPNDDLPDLLTVHDIQNVLQVSRFTVYRLIKQGVLPSIRVGRSVRVKKRELIDWIETGGTKDDTGA